MNRTIYTIVLTAACMSASIYATSQTGEILTAEQFIDQVKQFHPVIKQASLVVDRAAAGALSARGAFDPILETSSMNKSLDGVSYYHYNNPELKIPTTIGFNVKAGFENARGQFINPELTVGTASYVGLELPLLNGLFTDKKRTVLQQARIYKRISGQERLLMINELLFDAYTSYFEWAGAYQLYEVYNNYLRVAEARARLLTIAYENGDRAAADTMEAYAQVQNFRLLQADALLELNKRTLGLSLFLWSRQEEPYILSARYIPDTSRLWKQLPVPDTASVINRLAYTHPLLQAGRYKLQILEAERRLKFQDLLPTVNLQANVLSKDYFQIKNFSPAYFEYNYKFGIQAKLPLLFRQGRGEYKSIQIKIKEAHLDLSQKAWELENTVRQHYADILQLQNQVQMAEQMKRTYSDLLKTEELKFSQGESSLFLINARENKVLEIQQKIIALRVKYIKALYSVQWASGALK